MVSYGTQGSMEEEPSQPAMLLREKMLAWAKQAGRLERVMHDKNQVTSPEQLRVGATYKGCHSDGIVDEVFEVLEEPKDRMVKVARKNDNTGKFDAKIEICLTDFGVIPYKPSGIWNNRNYLVPVDAC
jgi:hypothetical protein